MYMGTHIDYGTLVDALALWDDIVEMILDTWLWHLVHGRGISCVIFHLFEAYGWHAT
jgi:hypothetical protein